jgi:hypothetical protein
VIEFTPDSYIIGLWYLELPRRISKYNLGGNFMSAAWKEPGDPLWRIRSRTRWYRTLEKSAAELVNSCDEFVWIGNSFGGSEDELIAIHTELFQKLAAGTGGLNEPEFFEVRGGLDRMAAIAAAGKGPDWFHMTAMPSDDAGGQAR